MTVTQLAAVFVPLLIHKNSPYQDQKATATMGYLDSSSDSFSESFPVCANPVKISGDPLGKIEEDFALKPSYGSISTSYGKNNKNSINPNVSDVKIDEDKVLLVSPRIKNNNVNISETSAYKTLLTGLRSSISLEEDLEESDADDDADDDLEKEFGSALTKSPLSYIMDVSALYFTEINLQSILFGLVTLLFVRWFMNRPKKTYNLPPGPFPLPIIGNLPRLISAKDVRVSMEDLRQQYGEVFKMKIGSDTMVFACGTESILEGLVKKGDELKGRPYWIYLTKVISNKKGIAINVGKEWRDLKKFVISTLRDLGLGKKKLEDQILEKTKKLGEVFESSNGKPFSLKNPMTHFSMGVIYTLIFGESLNVDDPDIEEVLGHFKYFFSTANAFIPENFLPILRYILWNSPIRNLLKGDKVIRTFIKKKITEHRESFNAENIRDLIDAYLMTLQNDPNNAALSETNMFRAIMDIFLAGTDTTALSLSWAFLYMAKYPDIQNKCREEIKKITNLNRPVKMEEKRLMPYVAATLLEVLRIAPAVPSGIPHVALTDTSLGGYDIPKDTLVSFELMYAHFDPKYWDKPKEFRPERWITDTNEFKKNEAFLPFSLGPRICAGMSLANMEIFIAFTNILQKFQFEKPYDTPMTMEGVQLAITYTPTNDYIRATPL
ncbi:cytochrome P450 2B4-like [Argonauta hians]